MIQTVEQPPQIVEGGKFVVLQSNCKLVFEGDSWAASDIGDYTNWTTGEAAAGRLFQPPGKILWAMPHRDYVLVGKRYAAYRGQYIGGPCKWRWDVSVGGIPSEWLLSGSRWSCSYCQASHPDGVEKCTSCGAPRN